MQQQDDRDNRRYARSLARDGYRQRRLAPPQRAQVTGHAMQFGQHLQHEIAEYKEEAGQDGNGPADRLGHDRRRQHHRKEEHPRAQNDSIVAKRAQQVKAMLLLAMARHAEVLILDEPTAGLDPIVRHEILTLLAASRHERRALIFSSHYGDDVATLADDVAFVYGGALIARAPVRQMLGSGKNLEQVFLEQVAAHGKRRAA